jgi:hypothetical protein
MATPGDQAFGYATSDSDNQRILLRRVILSLLAIGLLWRTWRFLLCFPIFMDEAMLCVNLQGASYLGLMHHLRNRQVAPLLFLWGELTSFRILGGSEWALRLLPFLAGVAGFFLFWRLARLTLPPLAATMAVGFLAVANWPVGMCSDAKPYAVDLFFAVLLLLAAVHWLQEPGRTRWLFVLCLLVPIAVLSSYPALFIAGGISLALVPKLCRPGTRLPPRLLWVVFNLLLVGGFFFGFLVVGRAQLQSPDGVGTTENYMADYWSHGFPPAGPWAAIKWAVLINTGQMAAYPLGSANGGSSLTVLLCLIGVWRLWNWRRRNHLLLFGAPFGLWFLAAVLQRYPYGGSGRLSQHVAPIVCLTAGLGTAVLLERIANATKRRRLIIGVCCAFVAIGIGGMVLDAIKPYRDVETKWSRQVMRAFAEEARASDAPIVVLNSRDVTDPLMQWYVGLYGDRVHWDGDIDWDQATTGNGELICLNFWIHEQVPSDPPRGVYSTEPATPPQLLQDHIACADRPIVLTKAESQCVVPHYTPRVVFHMDEFRCAPRGPSTRPNR